ncbi:MAG: single-stranded-DNA-specific exonuclease RecJ [SAR202 cluster bacterium Io17-Chloro-G2]|nr:MAG: single-stranded-DNA-specific exonuclease RecJ [SAR202 cluster bacterium Io17-Chloro-G2]
MNAHDTVKRWDLFDLPASHSLPDGVPGAVAQVLLRRGLDTAEKLRLFLNPPQKLPYDPQRMMGMDRAVPRLYQAVTKGEKVGIFGDFDVDGVTGTAILGEGLGELGVPVLPYLPSRADEGHGLSNTAVRSMVAQGVSLIITVDTGVTAAAEVAEARRLGTDVVITDHHVPQTILPEAVAIIDPNLPGVTYPFRQLCGAGLAFKLMQGLYEFCGQPWSPALLELAALGTIADLVPLEDENRYLVQQGLIELGQTQRPGLNALYRRARVENNAIDAETVSFQISPRLNSAGRMGSAHDSYALLTTKSTEEAETLADLLEGLNRSRRDASQQAYATAQEHMEQKYAGGPLPPILFVAGESIAPGVAGLVAGRLSDVYHRPAVALSLDGDYAVASGRSIPQFDIASAFEACEDLLVKFGGHSQAAGFTIHRDKLPRLEEALILAAERSLGLVDLRPRLTLDAEVQMGELTEETFGWLSKMEPFGKGNPKPLFLSRGVEVLESRHIGYDSQHLKLVVGQGEKEMTALAFNQADTWPNGASHLDLVYTLSADWWQGVKTMVLKVEDVRPAGG